jgi:hypothetical protein
MTLKRLLAFAVLAFVVAGCGASADPRGQVLGAARKTLAQRWVRYELTFETPRLFAPSVTIMGGRGAFEFKTRLGYGFLDLQKQNGGSPVLWFDVTPTALLADPEPAPPGVLPPGKVWISVPLSAGGAVAEQAGGLAPELPLAEIAWGTRAATHVGSSVVGHVPMDEYRVTVDLTKALVAATKAGLGSVAAAIDGELRAARSATVAMSVWVNGPGFVGRIDQAIPGSRLGTVSVVFTSFTRRYTGTLPQSAQIVPLASLGAGDRSVWAVTTGS